MDIRKFDKRIVLRNLDKGLISTKEYSEYMEGLKDLVDEAEIIDISVNAKDEEDEVEEEQTAAVPLEEVIAATPIEAAPPPTDDTPNES